MSLRSSKLVVWLSLVIAAAGASCLSLELAAQDTLQLYVKTVVTDYYHVYYDTGSGFSAREWMANTVFPSESRNGVAQFNLAVPPRMQRMHLQLGERPASLSIVRMCLVRSLMLSTCVDGAEMAKYVDTSNEAVIDRNGRQLDFTGTGASPFIELNNGLIRSLRPPDFARLLAVRATLFLASALFLFCTTAALLHPMKLWLRWDAALVFGAAAGVRALMFHFYRPGTSSDSDWFLRYLQFHIYEEPGSSGIVYPIFTTLFEPHRDALCIAQFLLGSIGAVLALVIIRSSKKASRWDILWALLATCLPVLIGMEDIILSESLALFLILAVLVALRGLMECPDSGVAAAGFGGWCALLCHTKPQFSFVILLGALPLAYPAWWRGGSWSSAVRRVAFFAVPVASIQVLVMALNFTCGNYLGTSSTLGYSLFNHAQQMLTCSSASSDPHVNFYCQARESLGPNASSTSYTAWMMYPAIHKLQEPFYRVTADYQRLSLRLIAQHPGVYAGSVLRSYADFWMKEVPMTRSVYLSGDRNHPALRRLMPGVLSAEHWARDVSHVLYFVLLLTVIARRSCPTREHLAFWAMMTCILIGSSLVQAFAESSLENSRYAVPTEPLAVIGIVYSTVLLKSKTPISA